MRQSPPTPLIKPPLPAGLFRMAVVFAIIGWGGVIALVLLTLPFLFPRWVFFFSLFLAFAGTILPIIWYLNRRFSTERFPSEGILLREALEVATLGVFLIWLQAGRMFTPFLGWIIFAVFLAVELLLRIYEHARWSPAPFNQDSPAEPVRAAPFLPDDESPDA